MAELPVRVVAAITRHPRHHADVIEATSDLIGALGGIETFQLIGDDGQWTQVCAEVDASFVPRGWIERRTLPAGEWRIGEAEGQRAEQLVARADGRPSWLVSLDELPVGENEAEAGGESFGLTTLIARRAGMRRLGVNLDVIPPGRRSARYHWHRREEECFLVLSGTGWLVAGKDRFRVGPGDFFGKPEGPKRAHQFENDGEVELRLLSIGERRDDDEIVESEPPHPV